MSKYGNEEKDRLTGYLSDDEQAGISHILSALKFVILNASLWNYKRPWKVPTRRITDNLILIGVDGALDITVQDTRQTIQPV